MTRKHLDLAFALLWFVAMAAMMTLLLLLAEQAAYNRFTL